MKKILFIGLLILLLSSSVFAAKDTFRACGKSWKVGAYGLSWNEAKAWINNLDTGWRTPSQSEVYSNEIAPGTPEIIGEHCQLIRNTDKQCCQEILVAHYHKV